MSTQTVDHMTNNELILSHFFHIVEKLGVVSNELQYYINTLEFYMGVSSPDPAGLARKAQNTTSPRWKETIRMHQTSLSLLSSIDSSFETILKSYLDAINNQTHASWIVYYSVLSCINAKLNDIISKMASLNHRLLQIRQSGTPKYNPTPPYVKRYQNILTHDFMSGYVNDIISRLHKVIDITSGKPSAVLLWEHTARDSVKWERLNRTNEECDNLIIMESFFALELPINLSLHIHEAMHYYFELLISQNGKTDRTLEFYNAYKLMRKNLLDFSTVFGLYHSHAETEYICDFLTYILFGESYLVSLYYLAFAHDAHTNLYQTDNGACSRDDFKGNIPSTMPGSWWSRLKVLANVTIGESELNNDWKQLVNDQLNFYHSHILNVFPREFEDSINKHITVEERFSSLVIAELENLKQTSIVRDICLLSKALKEEEREHFRRFKYAPLFSAHIDWFAKKKWDIQVKKREFSHTKIFPYGTMLRDITLSSYKTIYKILKTELDKRKDSNEKIDFLCKIANNPVPAVRLIRYVSRSWPYRNKMNKNLFANHIKSGGRAGAYLKRRQYWHNIETTPPLHCEAGMVKYRIDTYHPERDRPDQERYDTIKLEEVNDSLINFIDKGTEIKAEKREDTHTNWQAFISFGSYNIMLIRPNVSAKALTPRPTYDDIGAGWPPVFRFPYFINTHSLIRLDFNKKCRKNNIKKHGIFSCMIQSKALTNQFFPKVIAEIRNIINNPDKRYNELDWSIYLSAGWEDFIIIINDLSLHEIADIKKIIFCSLWSERTTTHIMLNCKEFNNIINGIVPDLFIADKLVDSGTEVTTKIRTRDHNFIKDVDTFLISTLKNTSAYQSDAIDGIYLTPGSHDVSVKWNKNLQVVDFIRNYNDIRENDNILRAITDLETNFSWRIDR